MDGQFVVRCVVNVVEKRSLFVVAKVGQGFEVYFGELYGKRDEKRTGNGKNEMRGSFPFAALEGQDDDIRLN
jgi:hypothetical protein